MQMGMHLSNWKDVKKTSTTYVNRCCMRGIEYKIELKYLSRQVPVQYISPPVIQGTHQEAPKMASQQVTAKKQQGEIQVVFGGHDRLRSG